MCYYVVEPAVASSGAAETVLLPHGEPSWSFLNRKLVTPITEAGHRVVMFDQVGFGRSDKPADVADYTSERHVAWNEDLLINHLDLRGITLLAQDWGGILSLRVAARNPARFHRIVVSSTFLPTGLADSDTGHISPDFYAWKKFANKSQLKGDAIGRLMARGMPLSDVERLAYDVPFPDETFKAGVRAFPELVPTPEDDPTGRICSAGRAEHESCWAVFNKWTRPVLTAYCAGDKIMDGWDVVFQNHCLGCQGQKHRRLEGGGHFVQDALGPELAAVIVDFIATTPVVGGEVLRSKL